MKNDIKITSKKTKKIDQMIKDKISMIVGRVSIRYDL